MKTNTRRKEILECLKTNGSVNILELAALYNVSSMTIRRDLKFFSDQGRVTLIHGGATFNRGSIFIHNLSFKEEHLQKEKNRIANFCVNLISEGSAVFIDCGSTTKELAEALSQKKNIVVMTNSLPVINILSTVKDIKLITVPGIFIEKTQGFSGQMTSRFIREFKIDVLFLGAEGFDISRGATDPDIDDTETKRILVKQATRVVLVVDHTKLGESSFMTIAAPREIDTIVTDKDADPEMIEKIKKLGIEVFLV